LVIGSGGSLTTSGTGTITATNVVINTLLTPENFGAVGDGVTNDCTAFTNASTANTDIWLTVNKSYALGGNCTITAQVNVSNNTSGQVPFIIKPGAVATFSQPPSNGGGASQLFTLQSTTSVADAMQRADENPMSNGGNWVVGTFSSGGITAEAGQLASNKYEMVSASATKLGYVLWTGSGAIANDQFAEITVATGGAAQAEAAVVRGSTSATTIYLFFISGPL
jgi:hypothetical protein